MFSKSITVFSMILTTLFLLSCADTKTKNKAEIKDVVNEIVDSTVNTGEEIVYTVSLGVMPDMNYEGEGMLIGHVNKDRVGEKAGLLKGDILMEMDGKKVVNLFTYTKILSTYKKGDVAKLTVKRNDQLMIFEAQF